MTDHDRIFLSYSHNDREVAAKLRGQLEQHGISVFKDDKCIREGDLWLNRLQEAVDACVGFLVLVGRDGVRRWVGAETQAALNHHFDPQDDAQRLPIFPILLGDTGPDALPAFLRLFQATPWNGSDALPERLLDQIRDRTLVASQAAAFEGCPFVGLDAFRMDQAQLFFGRQKETLEALACFDTRPGSPSVRWLEINGNSGAGKSSLMNAGLLLLVEQGWLWPRTGFEHWRVIGPMMPGEHPVAMLAEHLSRAFGTAMADVRQRLTAGDCALADWLRGRKQEEGGFLLAIDQFEELFTFADPDERESFDRLLAAALDDADCPLFVISTVRADFMDRFEELPRLVELRNRVGKAWTPPPIGDDGLREVIGGPARLAGLDVSEIQEAMVAEARDEPGALPLVENALLWLWEQREGDRLSGRRFNEQGGLAGILSRSADALLDGLGTQRRRALELLFRLVKVDPEGRRHARQRIPLAEAVAVAGGGEPGRALVNRLAGERARDGGRARGPLRLITVTDEAVGADGVRENESEDQGCWVNLIHETLIRSKGLDEKGKPQPYWPTLWRYIEDNKHRAARRELLQLHAREWNNRRGVARILGLAGWAGLFGFRGLATPQTIEHRYLRWSAVRMLVEGIVLLAMVAILGLAGESVYWAKSHGLPLEAITTRCAHKLKLGKPLPFPKLERVPPEELQLPQEFMMGSESGAADSERPVHPVAIARPFYVGATEVTFAQYDAFCEATGRDLPYDQQWGRDDRPVINVDWADAGDYASWLGAMSGRFCRLLSEAEWEYAARAGTTTEYALPAPEGSDNIMGKGLANCGFCGSQWERNQTAPVGSFASNAWGLYDMHGNVLEWVADCWYPSYEGAPADGQARVTENGSSCDRRVLRGGSWAGVVDLARAAIRGGSFPSDRDPRLGFRVVCSSPISDH